jgi:hypothetical protein
MRVVGHNKGIHPAVILVPGCLGQQNSHDIAELDETFYAGSITTEKKRCRSDIQIFIKKLLGGVGSDS